MRNPRRILAVASAVLAVGASVVFVAQADAAVPPVPTGMSLVFSDDFTGTAGTGLNRTNWLYSTGTGYPGGAEQDLAKFAVAMEFPIIPCDLCGSQEGLQRNVMKSMLDDIERRMPGRKDTMIRALANVRPSHLLDRKLFDFAELLGEGGGAAAIT